MTKKSLKKASAKKNTLPPKSPAFHVLQLVLPYTLVLVMMTSVFWIYETPLNLPITILLSAALLLVVFALCLLAETHRALGTIVITFQVVVSLYYLMRMQFAGWRATGVSFQEWVLTIGDEVENASYYYFTLLYGGTIFFGFVVYYFSKVLYRMSFLTLVSLLPCVLYAKVLVDINNVFVILIAVLNIAIYMVHRAERRDNELKLGRASLLAAAGVYLFILFLFCALFPKENDARYYDRFEDLFLGGDTRTEMGADFSELGAFSADAGRYSNLGNRRLYDVFGDTITYLKRQNFDYYNFENDKWYPDKEISDSKISVEEWSEDHINLSLSSLQEALQKAEKLKPGLAGKYGLESFLEAPMIKDVMASLRVVALNFRAVYYLAPARVVTYDHSDEEAYYATASGTFRRESSRHESDYEYTVYFYDELGTRNEWLKTGAADISMTDASNLLYETWKILAEEDSALAESTLDWYCQHEEAMNYQRACAENTAKISDRVRKLAEDLTKDCVWDYQKAEALQNYLRGPRFTYDLRYVAKDNSPEYFLFESRTGTCSDYASAFVLMARSCGLIVRYAEGYAPEPTSNAVEYRIKDSDSHAYPEVFIPNMGWRIYEPTSGNVAAYEGEEDESGITAALKNLKFDFGLIGSCFAFGFAGVILVVVFRVFIPSLQEAFFRARVKRKNGREAVAALYGRLVKKAHQRGIRKAEVLTPEELRAELAKYEIVIDALTEGLEESVYGEIAVDEERKALALAVYSEAVKQLGRNFQKRLKK